MYYLDLISASRENLQNVFLSSEVQFNALEVAVEMEIQGNTDCVTNYVSMNVHEMDTPYHTLIYIVMEVLIVWPRQT